MSSNDIESINHWTCTVCNEETKQINYLIQEYNRIHEEHEETNDSRKMKAKAFELLDTCSPDYKKALTIMNLAVKIIKSCNGLQ